MNATPAIDVFNDANVAIKWFHSEGEEEVDFARALLEAQRDRRLALYVLDLTAYEVGNALLRGRTALEASRAAVVMAALAELCPAITPDPEDLAEAATLARQHDLTFYDAAYAAVANRRAARLATYDRALLSAGLGQRPHELLAELGLG